MVMTSVWMNRSIHGCVMMLLSSLAACPAEQQGPNEGTDLEESTTLPPDLPEPTTGGVAATGDDLALTSTAGTTGSEPPLDACAAGDPALATRIQQMFGPECAIQCVCGDLTGIDCGTAWDGDYYYVKTASLETVAICGGACMVEPCDDCPPEGWTCPVH